MGLMTTEGKRRGSDKSAAHVDTRGHGGAREACQKTDAMLPQGAFAPRVSGERAGKLGPGCRPPRISGQAKESRGTPA